MVFAQLNRIQFGKGDVSILMSMAGTKAEPQAALIFENREPTKIGPVGDVGAKKVDFVRYNPQKDIVMLFSNHESIDAMIYALQTVKENTFGENNRVEEMLVNPIPM